ncbi:MAG: ABC transporter permease [Zoogloeaceae bacterium]|jgi:ABC-type nitrate/sulfonate/bicarbonate transport system permease component|nr:ABC transporter permease [Zoogloeaceae bacterium]
MSNPAKVLPWLSIPLFLAVWQGVSWLELVNPALFPPPLTVIIALADYFTHGEGWQDLRWSLSRVAAGYFSGAAAGIAIGLATGTRPVASGLLTPVFQMLRPIPPIAFVPVVIVWFGLTEWGKWFLVFWGVFFGVWLATHLGVQRGNETLIRAAASLGASRRQLLFAVQLPAALPVIFVGLRTAIGTSFYTLVAAELSGAFAGIAYRLEISQQNFQMGRMMAGLLVLGIVSALSDRLFQKISRHLVHWNPP